MHCIRLFLCFSSALCLVCCGGCALSGHDGLKFRNLERMIETEPDLAFHEQANGLDAVNPKSGDGQSYIRLLELDDEHSGAIEGMKWSSDGQFIDILIEIRQEQSFLGHSPSTYALYRVNAQTEAVELVRERMTYTEAHMWQNDF